MNARITRAAWDIEYETLGVGMRPKAFIIVEIGIFPAIRNIVVRTFFILTKKLGNGICPGLLKLLPAWSVRMLYFLCDAYREEEDRVVLKLHPKLAPYKAAIFPLLKNKPELVGKAKEVYDSLRKEFRVTWDDRGNIGKRYYSQDEIGTPVCITCDFQTLEDNTVTVRDRDTMKQERVKIQDLHETLKEK